jgi:hypothetical protein
MDEIREGSVMTNEQINIAIAEACGWKLQWQNQGGAPLLKTKPQCHCWEVWFDPTGRTVNNQQCEVYPPDYCNDLNAMHEAEKVLTEHQWDEYERILRLVCDGCHYYDGAGKELLHATARQRAEAVWRTLGK